MPPPTSKTKAQPAIVWFRYDLRLGDHPALMAAVKSGQPLLLAYVFDEETPNLRRLGGASRWWLHHSLLSLSADIEKLGATLHVFAGAAADILPRFAKATGASSIYWSRRYAAAEVQADRHVEETLRQVGVEVHTFNGSLGHEPEDIKPRTGGWYKVYSAYWKAAQAAGALDAPVPAPTSLHGATYASRQRSASQIADLGLLPTNPDWSVGLSAFWTPGEAEAERKLKRFAPLVEAYAVDRDRPAVDGSSQLSPHLRFGEISPRQVMAAVKDTPNATKFLQEIAWRDFTYGILFHVPDLASNAFDRKFRDFPPHPMPRPALRAWQRGLTGYPIVDAGMRQVWQTGWMHNRVRMITASFLVKHLLCDWRIGEKWFWDTLCDADPANNGVNWQWIAGTGPDAAPFFRIFNPVLQGEKFDPDGAYVKRFVPELARLPRRWIHTPWEAPRETLKEAGITLGTTYPPPIVDHAQARRRALAAYAALRDTGQDARAGVDA